MSLLPEVRKMIFFGWEKWFHEFPIVQVEPSSGYLGCFYPKNRYFYPIFGFWGTGDFFNPDSNNQKCESAHWHIEQFNLAVEFSTLYNFFSQMVWTMWIQIIVNSLTIKGTKTVFPLKMGDWKNVSEVACVTLARL